MGKHYLLASAGVTAAAVVALLTTIGSAQSPNPRFGQWKLKSDVPPPASNTMTYEPYTGKA